MLIINLYCRMKIEEIIAEIEEIQGLPYQNWISALGRKVKVDNLHELLDRLNYDGIRPPREWNQMKNDKT